MKHGGNIKFEDTGMPFVRKVSKTPHTSLNRVDKYMFFLLFSNTETNDWGGSACCKRRKRRATGTSRPS